MPYLLLSALIVVADQIFKAWCVVHLHMGGSYRFLPGVMNLAMVHNYGASWGILQGKTDLLLIVTGLVCLALAGALLLDRPEKKLGRLSLTFILGGAVGNAVDRLLLGYVVDMFETAFISFTVFNVADCFITVGAALLVIYVLTEETEERKQKQLSSRGRWEKSREAAKREAEAAEALRREFRDENGTDRGN